MLDPSQSIIFNGISKARMSQLHSYIAIIRSKPSTLFVNSLRAYSSNLFRITPRYPNGLGPSMTSTILNPLIRCCRSLRRPYGRRLIDTPGFSLSLMLLMNCRNNTAYVWSKWSNLYPILSIWWSHHVRFLWSKRFPGKRNLCTSVHLHKMCDRISNIAFNRNPS